MGRKFARNHSISYGFRYIHTFLFSTKIQDDRQKWRKLKIFPFCIGHSCTTLWVEKICHYTVHQKVGEEVRRTYFTTLWVKKIYHYTVHQKVGEEHIRQKSSKFNSVKSDLLKGKQLK